MATPMIAGSSQRHRTCQQCRLRKVRCDGRRGICGNCDRLQFACSFQNLDSSSPALERPERLRARQACSRCHSLKVRCSGHLPACIRCQKRGRECVYSSSPLKTGSADGRKGPTDAPQRSSEQGERTNAEPGTAIILSADTFRNPDNTEIQVALDLFFERIYPLPGYAFLHRASLYDRFHRGQADQSLLLSILAISISLTETDLSKLRCMMCLGEYSSAFPLVSLLSRFAFSLRLNYDNQRVCFLAREARRRLMWAIYMLDQTWAAGLLEFTTCPVDAIYVGLPCPEETWELDVCPETDVQLKSQTKLPGLLAANVGVCYLRDKVLRHAKRFAAGSCSATEIIGLIESVPASTLNQFDPAFVLKCREQCWRYQSFHWTWLFVRTSAYASSSMDKGYMGIRYQYLTVARTSPSVQIIERDLKDLIDETRDQNAHPENCPRHIQQQGPRQILSIHSLIARSEFVDDSEELALQDAHASDNFPVYQKDNHEYSESLDTLGLPSPLPSFDSVEGMTPGPTMTSQMWLQGANAFEGAWDEPGIGFDLIRQMQWDGMGYFG
ncbi:hypothetical protein RU639_003372 [Aspergillus parasiticus]